MLEEKSILKIEENGDKFWINKGGELHRLNGPAVEFSDGCKIWYCDGKLHRIGGPAIEKMDGTKEWYEDDKRHRIDGPAIDSSDGIKLLYLRGIYFCSKEKFFEALTDEEKSIALFSEDFHNA
jgi:hypothetical protein